MEIDNKLLNCIDKVRDPAVKRRVLHAAKAFVTVGEVGKILSHIN